MARGVTSNCSGMVRNFVIDVTVACPATRHMTRTQHTGTVPGAAGGYAQACKRRKYATRSQLFVIETGGRVHRATLQFVHDKLVNAPVGVEARETNGIAIILTARTKLRVAVVCAPSVSTCLGCLFFVTEFGL